MEFKDDIFVIGAYVNNIKKEETLVSLIERLKPLNIPILLSAHYPISAAIQNMVDYYIFDKDNPVLQRHEFQNFGYSPSRFWTATAEWLIAVGSVSVDYAEWVLLRNAVNFIKDLNINNVHYLTYDNIPDMNQYTLEFLLPMRTHDVVVMSIPEEYERYASFIFSIKTDLAVNIYNTIKSKEQYYTINTTDNLFLENVMYRNINLRTSNIYLSKYSSNGFDLALHNNLDKENFTYFLLCDDKNNLYLNLYTPADIKKLEIDVEYIDDKKTYFLDKPYYIQDGKILNSGHNEFIVKIGKYIQNTNVTLYYNEIVFGNVLLELDYETHFKYYAIHFKEL